MVIGVISINMDTAIAKRFLCHGLGISLLDVYKRRRFRLIIRIAEVHDLWHTSAVRVVEHIMTVCQELFTNWFQAFLFASEINFLALQHLLSSPERSVGIFVNFFVELDRHTLIKIFRLIHYDSWLALLRQIRFLVKKLDGSFMKQIFLIQRRLLKVCFDRITNQNWDPRYEILFSLTDWERTSVLRQLLLLTFRIFDFFDNLQAIIHFTGHEHNFVGE